MVVKEKLGGGGSYESFVLTEVGIFHLSQTWEEDEKLMEEQGRGDICPFE